MRCRLWWPVNHEKAEGPSSNLVFGWFISCSSTSVDVVVAFLRDEACMLGLRPPLEELLSYANTRMPFTLQHKSDFSLIGKYSSNLCLSNGGILKNIEGVDFSQSTEFSESKYDSKIRNWISVVNSSNTDCHGRVGWIPKLQFIFWNERLHVSCDVHVIFYETPLYGNHYYCIHLNHLPTIVNGDQKKPEWMTELNTQESHFDVETVLCAVNCSAAVETRFCKKQIYTSKRFCSLGWELLAFGLASFSTAVYIILQCLHGLLAKFGDPFQFLALRLFEKSSRVIRYHICQIQYWPVLLQGICNRSTSCVEYAEKDALRRHSMWSTLAINVLLGILIGLALLLHAESCWLWVSNIISDITNQLLRSGCVWLMGVPAGFKLNTELAGALGMLSLNVIQAWFTTWVFMAGFFAYLIKLFAILGLTCGATMLASLAIDFINLCSIHVSALHWIFSTLYSHQTRAISSLWRLFRGRKMNPLRQRLDSYDYFVKQHIVGSLLFTPLLLLLPTTSVFYIYFTILKTSITTFCVFNEILISLIYRIPYVKIIPWLAKRSRFPSGIWFQIVSCKTEDPDSSTLISLVQSNFFNLRELIWDDCEKPFSGITSFVVASMHGALTGKRTSSSLDCPFPTILPWMSLPAKDYWFLCYKSVLGCRR